MVDFRIDVIIDPRQAKSGAKQVDRALDQTEKSALDLKTALQSAVVFRDAGLTATLDNLNKSLLQMATSAKRVKEETEQLAKDVPDPFKEQLQSLRQQTEQIKLRNSAEESIGQTLLIEAELRRKNRDLTAAETRELLTAVSQQRKISEEIKRRGTVQRSLQSITARTRDLEIQVLKVSDARKDALREANRLRQQGVRLTKGELRGLEQQFQRQRQLTAEIQRQQTAVQGVTRQTSRFGTLAKRAFAGIGLVLLTKQFIEFSDTVTNVNNRLRLVTTSTQDLADTQRELFNVANETRSSFEGTATIFGRLALASKELGKTNRELLSFTKSLNQAIILSGASAQEASAGLLQLSQGLASGTLRGDELRSVMEQLPAVARVISRDLGITTGQLRLLGQQGLITSEIIISAFERASDSLQADFATTIPTIGQSFTVLNNKILESVFAFNESSGASEKFAKVILSIADNLDGIVLVIQSVAIVLVTKYVVSMVIAARATDALTASQVKARIATIKLNIVLGLAVVAVTQVSRVYRELNGLIADYNRNIQENETERALNVQGTALQALRREQEQLNKVIRLQGIRGVEASESQLAQLAKLKASEEDLINSLRTRTVETNNNFRAVQEKLQAEKDAADSIVRQDKLLASLEQPEKDRNQRIADLNTLLAAGVGDAALLTTELEKLAKASEKARGGPAAQDPFEKQLESLKARNSELQVTAGLEGGLAKFAKIKNDLAEKGRQLGFVEQAKLLFQIGAEEQLLQARQRTTTLKQLNGSLQLRENELLILASNTDSARRDALLIANQLKGKGIKLDEDEVSALTKKLQLQRGINEAVSKQNRVESLARQLDVTAQLTEQEERLLEVRRQNANLTEEVDAELEGLRLRQLEASNELAAGFERAFIKIKQEAEDLAAVGEDVVNSFANNATDALVEFAKTGEFQFKEFADAVVQDLIRIIARLLIVQAIQAATGLGGTGPAVSGALNAGAQFGATVQPGQAPRPVGEAGPELFVANRTGVIVPNAASVQGPPPQVNIQLVTVENEAMVAEAIASGSADEAIIQRIGANRDRVNQAQA